MNNKIEKQEDIAFVVLKSGWFSGEDIEVKILNKQPTKEVEEEFENSSYDKLDFIELNDAMKKATKQIQLDNKLSKVIEPDEDKY